MSLLNPLRQLIVDSLADAAVLRAWVDTRRVSLSPSNTLGATVLHYAAELGAPDASIDLLVDANMAVIDARDDSDQTPLHYAAAEGRHAAALRLLHHGANVCARDTRGDTPLHVACTRGDLRCVRALVDAAPEALDVQSSFGYTPLHCAARARHAQLISFLVAAGANLELRDFNQQTPRELAIDEDPALGSLFDRVATQQRAAAAQHRESLEKTAAELAETQARAAAQTERIAALERELAAQRAAKEAVDAELAETMSELKQSMMDLAMLKSSSGDLDTMRQQMMAAEERAASAVEKQRTAEVALQASDFARAEENARNAAARAELERSRDSAHAEREFFSKEWKTKYGELEARLKAAESVRELHEQNASRVRDEYNTLVCDYDHVKEQLQRALVRVSTAEATAAALSHDVEKLQSVVDKGPNAISGTIAASSSHEVASLRTKLATANEELDSLRAQQAESKQRTTQLQAALDRSVKEVSQLTTALVASGKRADSAAAAAAAATASASASAPSAASSAAPSAAAASPGAATAPAGGLSAAAAADIAAIVADMEAVRGQLKAALADRDQLQQHLSALASLMIVSGNVVVEAKKRIAALNDLATGSGSSEPK